MYFIVSLYKSVNWNNRECVILDKKSPDESRLKFLYIVSESKFNIYLSGLELKKTQCKFSGRDRNILEKSNRTNVSSRSWRVRDSSKSYKNLKLGQALLYCSKVDRHHAIMNIKKANFVKGRYERSSALIGENRIEKLRSIARIENEKILQSDYI